MSNSGKKEWTYLHTHVHNFKTLAILKRFSAQHPSHVTHEKVEWSQAAHLALKIKNIYHISYISAEHRVSMTHGASLKWSGKKMKIELISEKTPLKILFCKYI